MNNDFFDDERDDEPIALDTEWPETTFAEIAVQYDDPVTRAIQMGVTRAKKTLGIDD